jgi:c-di-GMP-binding flagellar brake protein YcgR
MWSEAEIIGAVAGTGGVSILGGIWLARRRAALSGVDEDAETVPTDKVLRTGLSVKSCGDTYMGSLSLCGNWTGRITRCEKTALSLSVEWESQFPLHQYTVPELKAGQSLLLTVTGDRALYRFAGNVRDVREDGERSGKRLLIVSLPPMVSRIQRRRFPRHALALPITVTSAERSTDRPQHGTIIDISTGGARMELGNVLTVSEATRLVETYRVGTLLRLRLPLPTLPPEGILARVCSCERTAQRGGLGVRVACEFLPMPEWDAELMLSALFRRTQEPCSQLHS